MSSLLSQYAESNRETPCELCGGDDFRIIGNIDRRGRPLATVICGYCGLVSHEQVPSDDELAAYYAQTYRADYHGQSTPARLRVVRHWRRSEEIFERLSPHLRATDRIIEIGSGMGCTVKRLELAGFDSCGIEPGPEFCHYSRKLLNAKVEQQQLQQLTPTPQFDVVLLVHVLEHFNRPVRSLRHVHRMMNKGGRLYIEVPNFGAPHAGPGRLFHFAHIYNFTATTLAMLAAKVGFQPVTLMTPEHDKNLIMLFEVAETGPQVIDPTSVDISLTALQRYSKWSYAMRPSYLGERLYFLWQRMCDRLQLTRKYEKIVSDCLTHGANARRSAA